MDCNVSQSFCTVILCIINQLVNLLACHSSLAFCVDTTNGTTILNSTLKYNKLAVFYDICHINKLHAESCIRFIGTVTIHSLLPCHSRNRKRNFHTKNFFKQHRKESFIDINDIINIYERQLHIHLCELWLTVCSKILVTETFCNLEISVITRTH